MDLTAEKSVQLLLADSFWGYRTEEYTQLLESMYDSGCAAVTSADVEAASCASCGVRPSLCAFKANSHPFNHKHFNDTAHYNTLHLSAWRFVASILEHGFPMKCAGIILAPIVLNVFSVS